MFDEFFGLPTHPFAIHAPLVLIPIAAVASLILTARSDARRRIGWFAPPGVFLLAAMVFVAKESGEALLDSESAILFGTQQQISDHQSLGETTLLLAIAWFLLVLAVTVRDMLHSRAVAARALSSDVLRLGDDRVALLLQGLATVAAIATTVWLIRTGHAGAESRWGV